MAYRLPISGLSPTQLMRKVPANVVRNVTRTPLGQRKIHEIVDVLQEKRVLFSAITRMDICVPSKSGGAGLRWFMRNELPCIRFHNAHIFYHQDVKYKGSGKIVLTFNDDSVVDVPVRFKNETEIPNLIAQAHDDFISKDKNVEIGDTEQMQSQDDK